MLHNRFLAIFGKEHQPAGIARRHAGDDPELQAGAAEAGALLGRSCAAVNHIAGIQRSGRSPGGLQLRGAGAAEPEAA